MQTIQEGDAWMPEGDGAPRDAWELCPEDRYFVGGRPQHFIVVPPSGAELDGFVSQIASIRGISSVYALSMDEGSLLSVPPESESVPPIEILKEIGVVLTDLTSGQATQLLDLGYEVYANEARYIPPPPPFDRGAGAGESAAVEDAFCDDEELTWSLKATQVSKSKYTGSGIKVAVLDTGCDPFHPDFSGRILSKNVTSFVTGESAVDKNGHGTHVCGTIAGPLHPKVGPRYGVAPGCELLVVKVLSNSGAGYDSWILKGLNWAVARGANIINMSLGSPRAANNAPNQRYEALANSFLNRKVPALIVAASGNDSDRPCHISPVGNPAACNSILAIAAIDRNMGVARFSCGQVDAAAVDLSGPGVDVLSAALGGGGVSFDGTSMAAPHVSGVAALWAESNPRLRGGNLLNSLLQAVIPLEGQSARDVGKGLVQAP